MIKDVVVNLQQRAAGDPARDFAISVARTFGAHLVGVSFAFVPDFPGYISPQLRPDMFAEVMARSEAVALTRNRSLRGRGRSKPGLEGASHAESDGG